MIRSLPSTLVMSNMLTYSRPYFELPNGMSSNGIKRRSLHPSIVSKMEYFTGALDMWKEGMVFSVVRVLLVAAVYAVLSNSLLT